MFFPVQSSDLKDSPSATSIAARHDGWQTELAGLANAADDDALWNWLHQLDDASRMALLAHCVSYGVNALQGLCHINSVGPLRTVCSGDQAAMATEFH